MGTEITVITPAAIPKFEYRNVRKSALCDASVDCTLKARMTIPRRVARTGSAVYEHCTNSELLDAKRTHRKYAVDEEPGGGHGVKGKE